LRIISGTHKGRQVNLPAAFKLRPTTDMARESLFNILNNIMPFEDLRVLDLFSGSGSISYEFASRGASTVHAVELRKKHASFIRSAARSMDMDSIKVFSFDVRRFLPGCTDKYDLIFADPPYDLNWLETIPALVLSSSCLQPGGLFILEHPRDYSFREHEYFSEHRKYGSVNFTFFRQPRQTHPE